MQAIVFMFRTPAERPSTTVHGPVTLGQAVFENLSEPKLVSFENMQN